MIKVLVENTNIGDELKSEHGLSIYIETLASKLLFDTGSSGLFLENAEKLGVNITNVDSLIISHGHNDHGGGLGPFIEANTKAKIYIGEGAFINRETPKGEFRGLDLKLQENSRINFVSKDLFFEDFYIFSMKDLQTPIPVNKYFSYKNGVREKDDFSDEIYLIVKCKTGLTLISGCCHKGIENAYKVIQDKLDLNKLGKITTIIGGLHTKGLIDLEDQYFNEVDKFINDTPCAFYLGHCTGEKELNYLENKYKNKVFKLYTGKTFDL